MCQCSLISNIGPEKVDLTDITFRYWFTNESGRPQSADLYYASQIAPALKLVNIDEKGVDLAHVKIRYYFTNESGRPQSATLYYADCELVILFNNLNNCDKIKFAA